jgi:hypothetical protein
MRMAQGDENGTEVLWASRRSSPNLRRLRGRGPWEE